MYAGNAFAPTKGTETTLPDEPPAGTGTDEEPVTLLRVQANDANEKHVAGCDDPEASVTAQGPAGSVRNNLDGAAGVRQDPMYDEIKASLPETEYAPTDEIRPQRTLTEETDPANIYMAGLEPQGEDEQVFKRSADGTSIRLQSVRRSNPLDRKSAAVLESNE